MEATVTPLYVYRKGAFDPMKCWKCGQEMPQDAKRCSACGAEDPGAGTAAYGSEETGTQAAPEKDFTGTGDAGCGTAAAPLEQKKPAARPRKRKPKNPLPTGPVPVKPKQKPGEAAASKAGYIMLTVIMFTSAVCAMAMEMWHLACLFGGLAVIFVSMRRLALMPPGQKEIYCNRSGNGVLVTWGGREIRFAIAINGVWAMSGTGNKVQIPPRVLRKYAPEAETLHIVLARMTDKGTEYCGEAVYTKK